MSIENIDREVEKYDQKNPNVLGYCAKLLFGPEEIEIAWLSNKCGISGSKLLEFSIQFGKILGADLELSDVAQIEVKGKKIFLSLIHLLRTGKTWYEKYGFIASRQLWEQLNNNSEFEEERKQFRNYDLNELKKELQQNPKYYDLILAIDKYLIEHPNENIFWKFAVNLFDTNIELYSLLDDFLDYFKHDDEDEEKFSKIQNLWMGINYNFREIMIYKNLPPRFSDYIRFL